MSGGGRREPDPFEGMIFDDAFVAGAPKREDSAAERKARAKRAAAAQRELEKMRKADRKRERRRRRRRRVKTVFALAAVVALLAGVAWVSQRLRAAGGATASAANDLLAHDAHLANGHPLSLPPASDHPLGTPAPTNGVDGPHAFLLTGANGEPAAYNPCRPIAIVVNTRTQPVGGPQALSAALSEVTDVTGLQFTIEGLTDEKPSDDRELYQPERYGDRWAPVLVAWTDPSEAPRLGGDTAGFAGSSAVFSGPNAVYVSGSVSLDGPAFAEMATRPEGPADMKAIILHELGHLVGLDHVKDESQIMYPENTGQADYAGGDRAGLARLGAGPCIDP